MKKEQKTIVTVPRDKWQRGERGGSLWTTVRDCGCIMGHVGLALGYTKDQLDRAKAPTTLCEVQRLNLWPDTVVDARHGLGMAVCTQACWDAIDDNDTFKWSDADREEIIKSHLERMGFEVRFTGEYRKEAQDEPAM